MSVGELRREPLGYFFSTQLLPAYSVRTSVTCADPLCISAGACRAHERVLRTLAKRARKDKQRALSDKAFLKELQEALGHDQEEGPR